MLVFMWLHYHPEQLGRLNLLCMTSPLMTAAMNEACWDTFFFFTEAVKYNRLLMHIHTCFCTLFHTSTWLYCICHEHTPCITVCWFLHRHANMLTCQCDAYYGCLWQWKLTFSMVLSLKGGDDTDYKSTQSAHSVMVYYTLFYCGFDLHW